MVTFLEPLPGRAVEWIQLSSRDIVVRPRSSAAVRAQVTVPSDRQIGAAAVKALRVRATAKPTSAEPGWTSAAELPVLLVLQDPRAPAPSLQTVSFQVVRANPQQNPTALCSVVRNDGGRVARATGRITLERTSGQEIAHMDIGADKPELILPGGEREFRMPIPPLDKGEFRIRAEIHPGNKEGKVAKAEETFETYVDIPEGLKESAAAPSASAETASPEK